MSFRYEEIEDDIYLNFRNCWNVTEDTRYVKVSPEILPSNIPINLKGNVKCILPHQYESIAEKIKNLEVREDDVWIITYPRSGTTWTQEMVWLLKHNLDFESAKKTYLSYRSPFLEFNCIGEFIDMIDHVEKLPSPRCIKTHLPIQFLPDQIWTKHPKMIYVKRNFKDMAVSYCHLYEGYRRYSGSMEIFMNALMGDYLEFSPYFPHIKNYCDASKVLKNFMVLNYEDMAMDLQSVIKKVASYLEVPILQETDLCKLCEHLWIGNMKKNFAVNCEERPTGSTVSNKSGRFVESNDKASFIRRGKVDGWTDELSEELSTKLDKWLEMEANKY